MKVNELTEGPVSNAISGLVGAARAKSKDPSIAAKGKRQLAKAGSRKAGSAAGTKRKKRQMVDGMLDAWSKISNKKLVAGQEPEEGDYLEWLGDFMGDARRAKLANLGAPEGMKDRHIRKHLQSVVNTFFDKPKAKMNDLDNVDMRNLSNARARQKSLSHQPAQIGQDAQFALPAPTRAESIIMQDKYNQYLLEADARIQHAEDIVFWEGSKGAKRALQALKDMASRKHKDVTLKWDGSPAMIFGRDEAGEFIFVDKSGFGKKGGVGRVKSPEALRAELLGRSGGKFKDDPKRIAFADNMARLFSIYEEAVPEDYRGFFKGDLLYASKPELVDNHYKFTPNIVTYAIDADTEMGMKIGASETGIVIHREVDAEGNEHPFKNTEIFQGNDVFVVPSVVTTEPVKPDTKMLARAADVIGKHSGAIDKLLHEPTLRELQLTDLAKVFYTYLNWKVDTGLSNLGQDFSTWVQNSKLSQKKKANILEYIKDHSTAFTALWATVTALKLAKNDIIKQFDAQGGDVKQSIGDQPGGEGYVMAHPKGDIKLVPRDTFSAANRAVVR